jgi:hypothetical protein
VDGEGPCLLRETGCAGQRPQIQALGSHSKERIQHSEHGESLKSMLIFIIASENFRAFKYMICEMTQKNSFIFSLHLLMIYRTLILGLHYGNMY